MDLFNGVSLQQNTFAGSFYQDYLRFAHESKSSRMSQAIFAIKSAVNTFISDLDGYIGLAPPRNGIERMRSFLFNAWKDGLIEHMVFALYTSVRNDIPSTLKFGSYDPSGIKDGE